MGLLVTLYLISINTYSTTDAPKNRGFSYIDLWMIGSQIPILAAILEYGFVLSTVKFDFIKKAVASTTKERESSVKEAFKAIGGEKELEAEKNIKKLDLIFFYLIAFYYVMFNLFYWILANH